MPKKDKAEVIKKDNAPLNGAFKFFIGGCLAEFYLMFVRKYYVNGNVDEMLAWDAMLAKFVYAGLAVLALGVILAILWRKDSGLKRTAAWTVVTAGVFFSAGSWLIRAVYPNGATVLCVMVAAAMLLGVLWCLYTRDCFYAMLILGSGIMAVWVCRHGVDNVFWRVPVIAGAGVYLLALLGMALLMRRVESADGLLGNIRLLPPNTDCTAILATCGLSGIATLASLFSVAIAYYALWMLGIVVFILAVYYTVKEL